MMRIFKYPVEVTDQPLISIPGFVRILNFDVQNSVLCMWTIVDPESKTGKIVELRIIGTGNPFDPDGLTYLQSVQMPPFVWHIFLEQMTEMNKV